MDSGAAQSRCGRRQRFQSRHTVSQSARHSHRNAAMRHQSTTPCSCSLAVRRTAVPVCVPIRAALTLVTAARHSASSRKPSTRVMAASSRIESTRGQSIGGRSDQVSFLFLSSCVRVHGPLMPDGEPAEREHWQRKLSLANS